MEKVYAHVQTCLFRGLGNEGTLSVAIQQVSVKHVQLFQSVELEEYSYRF